MGSTTFAGHIIRRDTRSKCGTFCGTCNGVGHHIKIWDSPAKSRTYGPPNLTPPVYNATFPHFSTGGDVTFSLLWTAWSFLVTVHSRLWSYVNILKDPLSNHLHQFRWPNLHSWCLWNLSIIRQVVLNSSPQVGSKRPWRLSYDIHSPKLVNVGCSSFLYYASGFFLHDGNQIFQPHHVRLKQTRSNQCNELGVILIIINIRLWEGIALQLNPVK